MRAVSAGGESQRIRIASQIGSGLTGVMYVLDEPSIGLHERDTLKLIKTVSYLLTKRKFSYRRRTRQRNDRTCRFHRRYRSGGWEVWWGSRF